MVKEALGCLMRPVPVSREALVMIANYCVHRLGLPVPEIEMQKLDYLYAWYGQYWGVLQHHVRDATSVIFGRIE
jgi:hypothetical protein